MKWLMEDLGLDVGFGLLLFFGVIAVGIVLGVGALMAYVTAAFS